MKVFTGKVVSTKMAKTATVVVERIMVHPVYKKRIRRVKKYHVHDELSAQVGQKIKFVASKPYSKLKRWRVIEIIDDEKKDKNNKASKKGGKTK